MIDIRFQSAETPLPRPKGGWERAPFKASFRTTLDDIERELGHLRARDIIVIADIPRDQIRMDGWPRSTAKPRTPGVTVTFTCRHGDMRYDCNAYTTYQDNIRAFSLTLERLRAIDRYGCTQGQQYAGWRALPAGEGKRSGGGFSSAEGAAAFMLRAAGLEPTPELVRLLIADPDRQKSTYRQAAMRTHPDQGGDTDRFAVLQEAKRLIEGAA